MNFLFRYLLLISLLFTLPVFIAAQSSAKADDSDITTKYDAAKDETSIDLKRLEISSDKAKESYLSVSISFKGKNLTARPDDVIFIISVISVGNYKYPDAMAMKITGDNKNLPDVLMLNLDKRPFDADFLETIGTRMKYDVFKKLAGSKTARLQLDKTTFELNEDQLSSLAKYESRINP